MKLILSVQGSCPPLRNSDTVQISCSHNDKEMKDCSKAPDGTIAKHQCAPFYEDIQLAKNPVRVCRNGSWDMKKPECVPRMKLVFVLRLI